MVLGFLVSCIPHRERMVLITYKANGYATHEFEVTPDRLGVYLPVSNLLVDTYTISHVLCDDRLSILIIPRDTQMMLRNTTRNYVLLLM